MKLLTSGKTNYKIAKGEGQGYLNFILSLSPSDLSGYNTCPKASPGCREACLNTAGRAVFSNVQESRLRKTRYYFINREGFLNDLREDLRLVEKQAHKKGLLPVVRLNSTSDLNWNDIIREFPSIQFYDYTKVLKRFQNKPSNYHLTFSKSEKNNSEVKQAIAQGYNVAMVFNHNEGLPSRYAGLRVINGDENDLRFTDGQGVIVGLLAKGKARKDNSGFVIHINQ